MGDMTVTCLLDGKERERAGDGARGVGAEPSPAAAVAVVLRDHRFSQGRVSRDDRRACIGRRRGRQPRRSRRDSSCTASAIQSARRPDWTLNPDPLPGSETVILKRAAMRGRLKCQWTAPGWLLRSVLRD